MKSSQTKVTFVILTLYNTDRGIHMPIRTKYEAKTDSIKGAFFAAIVGDALCLGSHYEYDAQKIYKAYGNKPIEKFMSLGEMCGYFITKPVKVVS